MSDAPVPSGKRFSEGNATIVDNFQEKKLDGNTVHVENGADVNAAQWDQLLQDAIRAEQTERAMGIRHAFKRYPKSVFWSFAISLCIVMEGYDTALLGSITGLPIFREHYGYYVDEASGYQLTPSWQTVRPFVLSVIRFSS